MVFLFTIFNCYYMMLLVLLTLQDCISYEFDRIIGGIADAAAAHSNVPGGGKLPELSTAARNLYISQQAVTKQIASLEQELGLRLFYRTTRQVTLTPAGSLLRDSFTQINRQIRSDIRKARELNSSGKSLLRVGFLSSLSRKDIILPITDFLMQHCPDTALDIRLLDFVVLRNSLLDDQLDFCVTTSNDWRFWPGIHTTVLQQKQFQVVYSARHPLAAQKQIALQDLATHTQLTLPNDNMLSGIEQWGGRFHSPRSWPVRISAP